MEVVVASSSVQTTNAAESDCTDQTVEGKLHITESVCSQTPMVDSKASEAGSKESSEDSKKKRKKPSSSSGGDPKKPTLINAKVLKEFCEERELKEALQHFSDKGLIPKVGNLKKLSKDALIKHCSPYAIPNVFQWIFEQRTAKQKNAPVLNKTQLINAATLSKSSTKNITAAVKALKVEIKNASSMKKEELITAIVLHADAGKVLDKVGELDKQQILSSEAKKAATTGVSSDKQHRTKCSTVSTGSSAGSGKEEVDEDEEMYGSEDEAEEQMYDMVLVGEDEDGASEFSEDDEQMTSFYSPPPKKHRSMSGAVHSHRSSKSQSSSLASQSRKSKVSGHKAATRGHASTHVSHNKSGKNAKTYASMRKRVAQSAKSVRSRR